MGSFSRLLDPLPGEDPGASQRRASACFPETVAASALHLFSASGEAPTGDSVLVGVALYSREDLALLDALDRAARARGGPRIDVLDTSILQSQADFEALLPGVGPVFQTPVVGVFRGGVLIAKGSGKRGRDLLDPLLG